MEIVKDFGSGDQLTTDRFTSWVKALQELQSLAVRYIQAPLWRDGNTLGATVDNGISVLWGKVKTFDMNSADNYVTVTPCDKDGTVATGDTDKEVHVFLGWPHVGQPDEAYFWNSLAVDNVLAYFAIEPADDGTEQGAALPVWTEFIWGKVISDWNPGDNFVMVRVCNLNGDEIGYTPNVKCWLFSPQSLTGVNGVRLKADDLILIDIPKFDPSAGCETAYAYNVYSEGLPVAHAGDLMYGSTATPSAWVTLSVGAPQSLLYVSAANLPAWLPKGTSNQILSTTAGGVLQWITFTGTNALLDGSHHTDTVSVAPSAGAIVCANSTPKWSSLAAGSAQSILSISAGGLPSWLAPGSPDSLLGINPAGNLAYTVHGDSFSIIGVDSGGHIIWTPAATDQSILYRSGTALAWLAKGTAKQVLSMTSDTPPVVAWKDSPMPTGGIIMWSGSTGSIPTGWALCDGSNGTPDLRSRFILGAGGTHSVGESGGPILQMKSAGGGGFDVQTAQAFAYNGQGMLNNNYLWSYTTNAAVPQNPGVFAIYPAYYALCFIMKL